MLVACPSAAVTFWALDGVSGNELVAFTGGGTGALDAIDGNLVSEGDRAEVVWDAGNYMMTARYRFATGSASESGIENIAPDDNPGGYWQLTDPPYCFGTVAPTNPEDWFLWFDTTLP